MPHSHAAHWLQKAVEQLRRVQSLQARQREAEVHRRLLECQGRINAEMPVWGQSLDITEGAQAAMKAVSGLSIMEALGTRAFLYTPPSPRELCRRNRAARRGHILSALFPFVMFNPSGQVTARQQTHPGDPRAAKREKRRVEMLQAAHLNWNVAVQGVVLPALAQINEEHTLREADLLSIVNGCLFVPPGREHIFTRGVLAGVQGDWLVATHLLVPQVENSLRTLLLGAGATPPNDVIEGRREWGMQEFLFDPDCWRILTAILGPNLLWDVRALLAEDFGGHLRPLVEHGLLPHSAFDGSPFTLWCVYLWWLTLRLCFHILQAQAQAQTFAAASESSASSEVSAPSTEAV